jgi:hypothetical protein
LRLAMQSVGWAIQKGELDGIHQINRIFLNQTAPDGLDNSLSK